jgi:Zn-dependent M28 family amino/carboxypeptidase
MNFDMTGDPYGYWTPGCSEPGDLLRRLAAQLAPLGMTGDHTHEAGLHSDHQPFMLAGVPIVGLMARLPEGGGGHYYHSAGDTFEKVSLPALCRAAAVAAHTLWALADVPERTFSRLTQDEVDAMIAEAGLTEVVAAHG